MLSRSFALTVVCTLLLPWLGGCCCCSFGGGNWTPNLNTNGAATTDGGGDGDVSTPDPNLSKEMQDARNYTQKALNLKGYGAVKTVELRKDGLNWYVSGTAAGLDGADVSYEVSFLVTRFEGEGQVTQNWAVQTVSVDGEVVYP